MFKKLVLLRPGSRLINLCMSGATTEDVIREQLDAGLAAKPDLVTLGIGINDIGHGMSVQTFGKNYETIITRLRNEAQAVVVVTNIPDISSAPRIPSSMRAEYQRTIDQFNQRLQEIAGKSNVTVFDIYSITRVQLPAHPEYFSADGFHPSDPGYEMWSEQMWPTLERVIGAIQYRAR
jgi:lysophospholipase L1-like esterase